MGRARFAIKRVATDAAGYGLLLLALLTGWLPGPGGIPLALAGLALLSIHNAWARRLRQFVILHGSTIGRILFVDNPLVQIAYDSVVLALLVVGGVLAWIHGERWQLALAISLIGMAFGIGIANRQRYRHIVGIFKHKR